MLYRSLFVILLRKHHFDIGLELTDPKRICFCMHCQCIFCEMILVIHDRLIIWTMPLSIRYFLIGALTLNYQPTDVHLKYWLIDSQSSTLMRIYWSLIFISIHFICWDVRCFEWLMSVDDQWGGQPLSIEATSSSSWILLVKSQHRPPDEVAKHSSPNTGNI